MNRKNARKVASIIRDAGGEVVGRTRLQKTDYLLEAVGCTEGFTFRYKNYGPFSEELALATSDAVHSGDVHESCRRAAWGGIYSIYRIDLRESSNGAASRSDFAWHAATADAIELALAATAVFLSQDGYENPWEETERRKPPNSGEGRLQRAKVHLDGLREFEVPKPLPHIS